MIIITITIIFIIIIVTNFKLPVNLIRVTIHEMYVMENGRDSNPSIDNCSDEISTPWFRVFRPLVTGPGFELGHLGLGPDTDGKVNGESSHVPEILKISDHTKQCIT